MNYLEADFTLNPCSEINADILKALAGEGGFESFTDTASGFKAYIQEENYNKTTVEDALHSFLLEFQFSYTLKKAEDKDWNETWEKEGFEPVYLGAKKNIAIHDTLHPLKKKVEYDILINPQLAFGTGTHETTGMLLEWLSEENLQGKSILDMGCGTGILGIFSIMRQADKVTAIDIDEWSVRNTKDNARLNHLENHLEALKGDASILTERGVYDVVIANINRNILLRDIPAYAASMKEVGSILYLSGFYTEDVPVLVEKAQGYGFEKAGENDRNNWASLKLIREKN